MSGRKDLGLNWIYEELHNIEVFTDFSHQDKKIGICIIKMVLENNGADHIVGSTGQDKSGITGRG